MHRSSLRRFAAASLLLPGVSLQAANFVSNGSGTTAWNTPGAWTPAPAGFTGGPQVGDGTDNATIGAGDTMTYVGALNTGGATGDFTVAGGSVLTIDAGTLHKTSGGSWTRIGDSGGAGTVDILNGGSFIVDGDNLMIGTDGGMGTITVDGAGSNITQNATDFRIGRNGTGVVTLNNGGSIVHNPGSWFWVGEEAGAPASTLNINSGSSLLTNADRSQIGANPGASGIINQTDGTADWGADGGELNVGVDGDGTYNLSGGVANVNNGQLRVAQNAGSTGLFDITGGTLNGGQIEVAATGTGTMNINGANSVVNSSSGEFVVGWVNASVGLLDITNGGTLNKASGDIRIGRNAGATGTVNVDGAGSQIIQMANDFRVGFDGTGTLNVSNGGLVDHQTNNWFFVGNNGSGDGTVIINDAASVLATDADQTHIGFDGTGSLTLNDGSATFGNTAGGTGDGGFLSVASSGGSTGDLTVNGGTLTIGEGANDNDNLFLGSGTATVTQTGGTVMIENNWELSDAGGNATIMLAGGTLTADDILDRPGDTLFGIGGGSSMMTVNLDNMLLNAADGTDTLQVTGAMQTLNIANNLVVGGGDTFKFILDGSTMAFNPITVGNNLDLAGAMGMFDLTGWANGWVPFGTELPLVSIAGGGGNGAAGIFDNFGELSFVGEGGGRGFLLSRLGGDGNDLVLLVVPEPSRALLLALGAGALLFRRRRC